MMNTHEKIVRDLVDSADKKAHVEGLQRLMVMLRQEIRSAGIKGVDDALYTINSAIRDKESSLCKVYDDAYFELIK